jgi:Ca-activated chloride channel family protein
MSFSFGAALIFNTVLVPSFPLLLFILPNASTFSMLNISVLFQQVDTLTDSDRFTVLAFDSHIETPPGHSKDGLVAATDYNRQAVVNYLAKLEARGGIDMATPLQRAADALQAPPPPALGGFWPPRGGAGPGVRDRVLVLVTDGQVGNEDWIMGKLAPKLQVG